MNSNLLCLVVKLLQLCKEQEMGVHAEHEEAVIIDVAMLNCCTTSFAILSYDE